MNRLLVLFVVGVAFGAVARVFQLSGFLSSDRLSGFYVSALGFGFGVVAAVVAILLANYLKQQQATLHPRH